MSVKKQPGYKNDIPPRIEKILEKLTPGEARIIRESLIGREKAEKALKASEEKFSVMFEALPIAISVVIMSDGTLFDVNKAWLDMTGFTRKDEVIGRTTDDLGLKADLDQRQHSLDEFKKKGYVRNAEISFQDKSGEKRIVLVNYDIITIQGCNYVLSTHQDITYMRRMEGELNKEQKLESIGVLAAGIAHDFNNLLTGLFTYIELARESIDRNPDTALDFIDKALLCFSRTNDITRQLLTFSKGGIPRKKAGPLEPIINDALRLSLSGSSIRFNKTIDKDLYCIEADSNQLNQVFTNIFINARQAMPDGGVLSIEAHNRGIRDDEITGLSGGFYVEVKITDQGIGIPEDILPKVFDPFFTTRQAGSGLGLATVYSIIKKHGGHISITSKTGDWTSVTILLPAMGQGEVTEVPGPGIIPREKGKILLMDDDPGIRDTVALILSIAGFEVVPVVNGEEAIASYMRSMNNGAKFSAVILDLTIVGGMGGEETITKLLQIDPHVKAVVASGYSDSPILARHREYGFKGRISKPFCKKDLLQLVYDVIAG